MKAFLLICLLISTAICFAQDDDQDDPVTDITTNQFDNILNDSSTIHLRKIPDSLINSVRKDEAYWYANKTPGKEDKKKFESKEEKEEDFKPTWIDNLLWILIVAVFAGALIWYLASSNIWLFRKKSTVIENNEEHIITENIFEINYEGEINAAIANSNFRLATRLMFLRTLKELSDRELIGFKHEKTNSDYLFELSGSKYYKDFFRLTRDFEYTWYGKFQLSPESFEIVKTDFANFNKQLQ